MVTKVNYGKIIAVILITVLIWVWADLALDDELSVPNAVITVAKSTNPNLWVSFNDEPSAPISSLVLKGPASKIADAKRRINEGTLKLEFFLAPEEHGIITPGENIIDVLDIVQDSDQIKKLGLSAISCKPETLTATVVNLEKKKLAVKCVDRDQNPVKTATVEPAQVETLVPVDWSGEKLIAKIQLSPAEIEQARLAPIKRTPYIELSAGQTRVVPAIIKITTPPEEDRLRADTIKNATLGFTLSAILQGKYNVEVANLNEVISAIAIRATPEAKRAYENLRYQVILEIDDSDIDAESAEPLRRELLYNFPPEYIRKDEIMLNQQPEVARFRLIPLPSVQTTPAGD